VLDARRLTVLSLAFTRARDFNGSITTRRTLEPWTSHFQREREHGIGSNEPPAPVTSAQLILGVMNSASFATIPNARAKFLRPTRSSHPFARDSQSSRAPRSARLIACQFVPRAGATAASLAAPTLAYFRIARIFFCLGLGPLGGVPRGNV